MKQNNKILILVIALVIVSCLVFLLSSNTEFSSGKGKQIETKKPNAIYNSDQWTKSFKVDQHNAFDLYMFDQLLNSKDLNQVSVFNATDFETVCSDSNSLFLFVGDHFVLKQSDLDKLVASVRKGSTFFISTNHFSKNLNQFLVPSDLDYRYIYTNKLRIQGQNLSLQFSSIFQNEVIADFYSILKLFPGEEEITQLNGFTNTKSITIGKGKVIWNATPILLTNYYLEKKEGFQYFQCIAAQLPKLKKVWIELPKNADVKNDYEPIETPHDDNNLKDYKSDEKTSNASKGQDSELLRMIFSNPSLTFAYFLTIIGVLLFLFFRTKRMRPQVSILTPNEDGMKNYTENLARIYQTKSDGFALVQLMRDNFYTQIKRTFSIDLNASNELQIRELAERSNNSKAEITDLLSMLNTTRSYSINDAFIQDLAKLKSLFYQKSGIISLAKVEKTKYDFVIRRAIVLPSIFLFLAISFGFFGLFLLAFKFGFGIIFFIVALCLFIVSILGFSKSEIFHSKGEKLNYSPLFSKSITLDWNEFVALKETSSLYIFEFSTETITVTKLSIAPIDKYLLSIFQSKSNSKI